MRTSLYNEHLSLSARMISFGGWELPVQYSSIIKEHKAVRKCAGIFDVSHLGDLVVSGPDAERFLLRTLTNNVSTLSAGKGQYNIIPNDNGGTVDDIIVYRLSGDRFFLVINASNIQKDFDWMTAARKNENLTIENVSFSISTLALQGPSSKDILLKWLCMDSLDLKFCHLINLEKNGIKFQLACSGYTGENGYEIFVDNENAPGFFREILDTGKSYGLLPCGLGARDTLRLEAALNLYGHELNDDVSAIEAGVSWAVKFDHDFIGKDILQKQKESGVSKKLTCVIMDDRAVPRAGYEVYTGDGEKIGWVSSGSFSPTLKKPIAICFVPPEFSKTGSKLNISIRNQMKSCTVVRRPFYKRNYLIAECGLQIADCGMRIFDCGV